jgi:tetratricopeptide (TPR) repeat protein
LERAVSLDPDYAYAWAGLAYAHRTVSLFTTSVSTQETYQKSIAAINKALSIDENLSEAHSALCENKYLYEWDFAEAEAECKRAIELDLNSSQAHEIYARFLMGRGRQDEAMQEIETAVDLEPASRFNQRNYGRALFYARRYAEAATQFERVLQMDQSFVSTYLWLTSALALQGDEAKAFESLLKLLSYRKVDEATVQVFKKAFQASGWRGVMSERIKRTGQIGGTLIDRACYSAQLGNDDEAFRYLEQMYERREIWMAYLRVDPRLDPLRNDNPV